MDAMPANIVPGRKAGKDHARSQCPLRGEDLQCQSTDAGQSPQAVARKTIRTPNPFREASSGLHRENKDHRERALSRGSLRSREKRERRNQSYYPSHYTP